MRDVQLAFFQLSDLKAEDASPCFLGECRRMRSRCKGDLTHPISGGYFSSSQDKVNSGMLWRPKTALDLCLRRTPLGVDLGGGKRAS